jgi:hypothetical protein
MCQIWGYKADENLDYGVLYFDWSFGENCPLLLQYIPDNRDGILKLLPALAPGWLSGPQSWSACSSGEKPVAPETEMQSPSQ